MDAPTTQIRHPERSTPSRPPAAAMPSWTRDQRAAAACAAAAAASGAVAAAASQNGAFRPSALIKMAPDEPLAHVARTADRHFAFVTGVEHYDGVYYYAIARDPFARGTAHTLIDQAPYRYGHPLHGWLAAVLSLGNPAAIPGVLFALSLLGLAAAGWWSSRLAISFAAGPWWGLAVAASPGLLYATTVSTGETVAAALILGTVLAAREQRWRAAYVGSVLCCFDKEQYVLVPAGLAAVHLAGWWRRRHAVEPLRLVALCTGPVLLALWFCYLRATVHQWPVKHEAGNVAFPLTGWHRTLDYAHALSGDGSFADSQLGALSAPVLAAMSVVLVAAAVVALPLRSELDGPALGLVGYTFCLDWRTLLYPHELLRLPSVALLLAVLALAGRSGAARPGTSLRDDAGVREDRPHARRRTRRPASAR